jgi:hypothetical protein
MQVVAQQTPSAQWPFTQSASAPQDCPSTFSPQLPTVWPGGIVHECPGAQSAWDRHDSVQAPFEQAKLPHVKGFATRQVPSPSQVRAELPELTSTQVASAQGVLAGKRVHSPLPSHTPVVPQVEAASLAQRGCPCPAGVGLQVPTAPVWLQDWQDVSQAESQQIPSAQWRESHSASAAQVLPFSLGPQLPPRHFCVPEQSSSLVHTERHVSVALLQT